MKVVGYGLRERGVKGEKSINIPDNDQVLLKPRIWREAESSFF